MTKLNAILSAIAVAACGNEATRVHLDVAFDGAWGLDRLHILIGSRAAESEPLSALDLLVPDEMAGSEATLEVWGLRAGQQTAYGTVQVTPIAHATVSATIALAEVSCGAWCTEGAIACASDGSNGTTRCERQSNGCVGWSGVEPCPMGAPYCSSGQCAAACSDECTTGAAMCSSATAVIRCGNVDGDPCTDWSAPMACGTGETCQDGVCGEPVACAHDGDACEDGDPCTRNEECEGGTCGGGVPKCTTAPANADPTCSNGTCGFMCRTGYEPSGPSCVPETKRVFVTSDTYTGNLGGLQGADAKCQALASAAGLPGTYKAWLSTGSANTPLTRMSHASVPYVLVDGTQVASNWADLIDGTLAHGINLDEQGSDTTTAAVWTSTESSGAATSSKYDCADWTWSSTGMYGGIGFSGETDSRWTLITTFQGCSGTYALYCFQQ